MHTDIYICEYVCAYTHVEKMYEYVQMYVCISPILIEVLKKYILVYTYLNMCMYTNMFKICMGFYRCTYAYIEYSSND